MHDHAPRTQRWPLGQPAAARRLWGESRRPPGRARLQCQNVAKIRRRLRVAGLASVHGSALAHCVIIGFSTPRAGPRTREPSSGTRPPPGLEIFLRTRRRLSRPTRARPARPLRAKGRRITTALRCSLLYAHLWQLGPLEACAVWCRRGGVLISHSFLFGCRIKFCCSQVCGIAKKLISGQDGHFKTDHVTEWNNSTAHSPRARLVPTIGSLLDWEGFSRVFLATSGWK